MLDHIAVDEESDLRRTDSQNEDDEQATLIEHIERLLHAGRPAAVRPLLMALRRRYDKAVRLDELEARLLLAEGQSHAALSLLDCAIAKAENDAASLGTDQNRAICVTLYLLRGQVHVSHGDITRALADSAAAVMCDRAAPAPKLRLGVLLTQIGRFSEAIACLKESLACQPIPDAYRGLATAFERAGQHSEAADVLAEAVRLWPKEHDLRAATIMHAIRRGDYREAISHAEAARRDGAINADIFTMMGHALATLGEHQSAAASYRDALIFSPDDALLTQLFELSLGAAANDRIAPARVRALFDLVANEFDQNVVAAFYRVPGLVLQHVEALIAGGEGTPGSVLDIGCGTGLVALAISDSTGPITGVDISPAMLAKATAKNIFAELIEADVQKWLSDETRRWPLIVAGELLPYFGDVALLLQGVAARLEPGGRFIFSVTAMSAPIQNENRRHEGWLQGLGGRFMHSEGYITEAVQSAGLTHLSMKAEILRVEAGLPVAGWIVVVGKAQDPLSDSGLEQAE